MIFKDHQSLYVAGITVMSFIFFCLMDVTGLFPAMENMAIRIIIVVLFLLVVLNVILAIRQKNNEKNLPIIEEKSSPYRQI